MGKHWANMGGRTWRAAHIFRQRTPDDFPPREDEGMDDKKLMALAKKNAAASLKKPKVTPKYDSTLAPDPEDVEQLKKFHNEMKKREF
ncbi:MAG: hypothetical protein ACHQTF_01505 [Gemmatimonadales bacterium]